MHASTMGIGALILLFSTLAISCVVVLNLIFDMSATIFANLTQALDHIPLYNKNEAYCAIQYSNSRLLLLPKLEGMYGALGYGGQYVVVVHQVNMVISFMGDRNDGASDAQLRLVLQSLNVLKKEINNNGCAAALANTLESFLDSALSSVSAILIFATIPFKTVYKVLFV